MLRAAAPSATRMHFTALATIASGSTGITMLRAREKCTVSRQSISTFRCENSRHLRRRASGVRDCSWRFVANFNESAEP
jgi:hypothetical protein